MWRMYIYTKLPRCKGLAEIHAEVLQKQLIRPLGLTISNNSNEIMKQL